ncbi:LysM peptidoglycan-binding domain-containing protein [Arhodomonas sp. AD133]|uniref:lytic transglycosylase domain-containing protein n=1 Tax=Arhodomonas sp. AD133 TaxID=3415009 RepID=UPI003EB8E5DF
MPRVLASVGLLAALLVPAIVPAASPELPHPEALEAPVAFWKRVYTEVGRDEALVHDRDHLARVYGVIDLPPKDSPELRRARVRSAVKVYRGVLGRLAKHPDDPHSVIERRVRAAFPEETDGETIAAAADNLRVQGGLRERFRAGLERSGRWLAHIRARLRAHGVPEALAAMPHVESSFNPVARSHAGAAGMWQFTRGTGRQYLRIDHVVDERLDPWAASDAAARLLADNYAKLGHWPLAVTAYNHGANGMRRAMEETGSADIATIIQAYEGPYFGFASRNFYPAILAAIEVEASPQDYFPGVTPESRLETVRVSVPDFMPVDAVAEATGVDTATLRRYNPALSTLVWSGEKFVPADYGLRMPAAEPARLRRALAGVPLDRRYAEQRPDQRHRVRSGESLSRIAAKYGVSTLALVAANGLANPNHIRAGQSLRIPRAGDEPRSLASLPVAEGGARYTVSRGDTLASIGRRFGIGVDELVAANDLANPDLIRPGQTLTVRTAPLEATAVASK